MPRYYTPIKISENISETPEGFLLCLGVAIARTGEQLYGEGETPIEPDAEGKVLIYRDEKDVFHVDAIASFEGKPITINHPEDFVDPHNWSYLAKGIVQNVRRGTGEDSDKLLADLLINDAFAIQLVKSGLREVSGGYEAEYIETAKGKGKQTNIKGNHLALVDKGRAGPACAINDHAGKGSLMTKLEALKAWLSNGTKVVDEAMASEKKDGDKEQKKEESKDAGMASMDELVTMFKDLGSKMDAIISGKSNDEKDPEKKDMAKKDMAKKEDESKDEEVAPSLEERLKALELAVSKMLEGQADKSSEMGDEDEEEMESEDDDFEESSMTGDTASRAEILAPGINVKAKDVKQKALKQAYATKEGKSIIDALTGGKPVFDSAEKVNPLFMAASEVMKVTRNKDLSKTKQAKDSQTEGNQNLSSIMTAEKMNEINAARYGRK